MKRSPFLLMAFAVLMLTAACGPVESSATTPRPVASIATSTPTPTVTPQKNTSDQLLLLGLTATVEFRGTSTKNAEVAGTLAATQTQIAATVTQKWEALTLTPAKQAMNQTELDQAKAKNGVDADKVIKDADAKAAAAKAEAEAQIAAAQADRERMWNRTISQVTQVLVDALPFVILVIIVLAFCALGALGVLWLVHYSRDREQKRRDDSARRRLSKNVGGQPAFYDGNRWRIIDQHPALPAPSSDAKTIQLPEVEIQKRRDKWDNALWRFCQYAERIINSNTRQYGSFTVNDMVNVYHIVERSDWDTITQMLMDSEILIKDSSGTRYGTDDESITWSAGRLRSALLTKAISPGYPTDDRENVLPPPKIRPPTVPIATTQSVVHATETEEG